MDEFPLPIYTMEDFRFLKGGHFLSNYALGRRKQSWSKQHRPIQNKVRIQQEEKRQKVLITGCTEGGSQQHFLKMQDESPTEISTVAPLSHIYSAQARAHTWASLHTQEEVWQACKLTTTKKDKSRRFLLWWSHGRETWKETANQASPLAALMTK
jgi:hypothetical protein